jgi:lactate dehydrogenase-like 2-hydroxyacid dehydrogenase
VGGDLRGKTLGIVGLGTIGSAKTFYRDTVENIAAWLDGHPLRVAW